MRRCSTHRGKKWPTANIDLMGGRGAGGISNQYLFLQGGFLIFVVILIPIVVLSEQITTPTPRKKSVYAKKTSCVDTDIHQGFSRDQGGPHYKSSAENNQFRAATNPCREGRAPASIARTGWGGPRGCKHRWPGHGVYKKR